MSVSRTIEAWLTKDRVDPEAVRYPVVLPTPEIIEFAAVLDYTIKDLFDIYMPTGFSRVGHVKFLVDRTTLIALYPQVAAGSFLPQKWWFRWKDGRQIDDYAGSIEVYLLPPRPLFARNSSPENGEPPALFLITGEDNRRRFQGVQVSHETYTVDPAQTTASNIVNASTSILRDALQDGSTVTSNVEGYYQRSFSSDGRVPPRTGLGTVSDLVTALIRSVWTSDNPNPLLNGPIWEMNDWIDWLGASSFVYDRTVSPTVLQLNGWWAQNKVCLNWNNQPVAMALDMILSNCNAVLVPIWDVADNAPIQFEIYALDNPASAYWREISETMYLERNAFAGGIETLRNTPFPTSGLPDPLMNFWQRFGTSNAIKYGFCFNRLGSRYGVSFPMRGPEQNQATNDEPYVVAVGNAGYGNYIDNYARLDVLREFNTSFYFGWTGLRSAGNGNNIFDSDDTPAGRGFSIFGKQVLEPRVIPMNQGVIPTQQNWLGLGDTSVAFWANYAWDFVNYSTWSRLLVENRNSLPFNKTVWAGWNAFHIGDAGYTYTRFQLAIVKGQIVPVTTTECEYDDWILGPNGNHPAASDPKDMVFSSGNVHARRILNGALVIDVPPPTTRTFAAVIISATRIASSGDFYWRWRYEWEEKHPPTPADTIGNQINNWVKGGSTLTQRSSERHWTLDPSPIKNYAFNLAEHGNNYVGAGNAANVVAPGVLQSDYTASTIDALPISVGTIVSMHQNLMTMHSKTDVIPTYSTMKDSPLNSVFWFSMPNAVKVTCI